MQGLARALGALGIEIVVATPLYDSTRLEHATTRSSWEHPIDVTFGDTYIVDVHDVIGCGDLHALLLDCPPLYKRGGIYGNKSGLFPDNDLRFSVMCMAALKAASILFDGPPDIIHAHDWHAGLALAFSRTADDERWRATPSVFTFHNAAYQGSFPPERAPIIGIEELLCVPNCIMAEGRLNFLKTGIACADAVTTVSPTYASEVVSHADEDTDGKESSAAADETSVFAALRDRSDSVIGIINGIDTTMWDPSRDRALVVRYDYHDPSGKRACKTALAAELGIDMTGDPPIVGMVTRLTHQKGADMLISALPPLLEQGIRFAIIATDDVPENPPIDAPGTTTNTTSPSIADDTPGDATRGISGDLPRNHATNSNDEHPNLPNSHELKSQLEEIASRYRQKFAFRSTFDEQLARRIYAGSDIFLMPSRFEPCGLGQQYAMRYGSVPIVSPVGGLADTVEPIDESTASGTGFLLSEISAEGIIHAVSAAAMTMQNEQLWTQVIRNCLSRDASWDTSARCYYALYRDLAGAVPRPSLPAPTPVG